MDNSSLVDKPLNYKLVLLGDTSVGKSCIAIRFTQDKFYTFQEPTIGAAFSTSILDLDDRKVKFEIWDTAGQERYRSLAPMYYRGAKFAVIVYDITSRDSFSGAKSWINEIKTNCGNNCIIILVGNKLDLKDRREIKMDEAKEYADQLDILYIEASAKSGENIYNIFYNIAKKLPSDFEDNSIENLFDKEIPKKRFWCF